MVQQIDLFIYNAVILTQSTSVPIATSMAILNGKIIALFEHNDSSPYQAKISIDAQQKVILPGFIDAHCHLQAMVSEPFNIHIPTSYQTKEAFSAYLLEQISRIPNGNWVRINGYHPFHFPHIEPLSMAMLDELSTKHPIRVRYVTRHTSVLNSKSWDYFKQALENHSNNGIHIELDSLGQPTGIIHGADALLNEFVLPKLPEEQWLAGIEALQSKLLSLGITTVCDASPTTSASQLAIWKKAAQHFWKIPVHWMTGSPHFEDLAKNLQPIPIFKRNALKIVLETMPEIYPTKDAVVQMMKQAFLANSPVAIHVVNPEMVWHAIDSLQTARQQLPEVKGVCRIEHLSLCPEAFFDMVHELQIQVVTNPPFIDIHGDRYLQHVDENEHSWLYPVNSLLQRGITVAAGSDAPVAPISPWLGMHAACTRQSKDGLQVNIREAVSRLDALNLYTTHAALVIGEQHQIGQLAPGFDANFIIVEHHPINCTVAQLQNMQVLETWIAGERLYHSS
ncbi:MULTISPECIES: amidohydrolase [unclassified Lysinibacillus]|uniref:amidohydrolase n=1 Tax=unclassified Lysinibacillus TaxID=2636778 RepID=UPI00380CE6CB